MKRVIEREVATVRIQILEDGYYYGALHNDKRKGIIMRGGWSPNHYRVCTPHDLVTGDYSFVIINIGLKNSIKAIIDSGYTVYQFDTVYALFQWLVAVD
jgi:hypothetical protein